jgi:hypothetical protein
MSTTVNLDNFVRAETNRMLHDVQGNAGGVNQWLHLTAPTPIDQQTVIRMNRDTLYSIAVANISEGAVLTVPEYGDRYVSVMIVNQDHYINRIIHEPGEHRLTIDEFDTPFVGVAARVLADPENADDVAAANAIQRMFTLTAGADTPLEMPDYDEASFTAVREAVVELGHHLASTAHTFGARSEVDSLRHLVGTAIGWGGLPEREAVYVPIADGLSAGEYRIDVGDVPVDAFWSVSVYNAAGFFEANARNSYSVNSITAAKNPDGTITVHLGGDDDRPNLIPIMDGWNCMARMYRPHPEVIDGTWAFPRPQPM